jgi:hypothetical protein
MSGKSFIFHSKNPILKKIKGQKSKILLQTILENVFLFKKIIFVLLKTLAPLM